MDKTFVYGFENDFKPNTKYFCSVRTNSLRKSIWNIYTRILKKYRNVIIFE